MNADNQTVGQSDNRSSRKGAGSLRFDIEDAQLAADGWGFNCGPGALCAVLNLTPDELRPHLGDFEARGYIGPTAMFDVLNRLKVGHIVGYRGDKPHSAMPWPLCCPKFGLVRVQWDGPWCNPGVPMRARYRHTHWVARRRIADEGTTAEIFDINAIGLGGWLPQSTWERLLVPWLIRETQPKASGAWWVTHGIELPEAGKP